MHISLMSLNFPEHFVRHRNSLGEITPISSQLDREDATFQLQDFTPGDSRPLMFRPVNFPLHVLRHRNFRVELHEFNPGLQPPTGGRPETPEERLLREDATFFAVRGLASSDGVSFRSLNFPDRFIRHRDFHLFVESGSDDLFRKDATFLQKAPLAAPAPVVVR